MLEELGDRHLSVTYDNGKMEVAQLPPKHGRIRVGFSQLIWTYAEELGISVADFGFCTIRSEERNCGLEPDGCFYIQNESKMRARDDFDPSIDPPPDLVIELDPSRFRLNRLSVYQTLGVKEVWSWENGELAIHIRNDSGELIRGVQSFSFPALSSDEVSRLMRAKIGMDDLSWIQSIRQWIRSSRSGH